GRRSPWPPHGPSPSPHRPSPWRSPPARPSATRWSRSPRDGTLPPRRSRADNAHDNSVGVRRIPAARVTRGDPHMRQPLVVALAALALAGVGATPAVAPGPAPPDR